MPIPGVGGEFTLQIHNCRKWQTLLDLTGALEHIRNDLNLVAYHKRPGEPGLLIEPHNFITYCETNYELNEDWDKQDFDMLSSQGALALAFKLPFADASVPRSENLYLGIMADKFGNDYNLITFRILLDRRTDHFLVDQTTYPDLTLKYDEKVMQLYVTISQKLIELLSPDYLWITEDDVQVPLDHLYGKDILVRRLETIYWVNYFGPNYLSPETESLFLNAPIGIVRRVAGGIWYQLHEEFETVPWQEAERIEEQVKFYFSKLNLDRVQWRYTTG